MADEKDRDKRFAEKNLEVAPYHDRFRPDVPRNKVLFRPDRPLQQSELNELQSIAEYNMSRLGDSIFVDGAMQTGMSFSIDKDENELEVDDGIVYVGGKVRPFTKQRIEFHREGTEKIGIKVKRKIIDHNDDPTLLDQTQGVDSHLSEGADRLEEVVVLTYNDDSAPTIYEFEDGDLFIEPDRPEFSLINDVLAQRTFEESGSFQVEGFDMWHENSREKGKVNAVIGEGKAYVLGYRIHKSTPTKLPVNKSTEYQEVVRETHTYDTEDRQFRVGSNSVKEIHNVLARTESPSGGVAVTKGEVDGRDSIPSEYTSIDRDSTKLTTRSPEKTFEYGKDYKIVEENGIQYVDWDTGLNGEEPEVGNSYNLEFDYDRIMKEDTDFRIETEKWEDGKGWDTVINFGGMTGMKPKNEGIISINYDFYLTRYDIVVLDSLGEFHVIEGQSNTNRKAKEPEHSDPTTLKIGTIKVYPNSDTAKANNNGVFRLRMKDLQKMKKRLKDVEHNQAILQLESEAIITEDPLELRGVFADAFTNFDRMDSNLSTISFSFEDASITLPIDSPDEKKRKPNLNLNESTASTFGRLVTAPFVERKEVNQPLASDAWNVNPYAVYNKMGILKLNPESDSWIEEEKVTLYEEDEISTRINRWWRHEGEGDPLGELSDFNQELVDNTSLHGGLEWGGVGGKVSPSNPTGIGAEIEGTMISSAKETRDEVIEYMRRIELEFSAENISPMADNLEITFDGNVVDAEPTGDTRAGTNSGTVRSDAQGKATGKFKIPADVRTGTREVTLINDDNMAQTTFTAQGTRKVTEETVTKTRVTFTLYDPLAQSFAFSSDRVVTSFDLYFASKSMNNENIIVQVRGLSEGGYPNRTVYAERTLTPDEINISDDGSEPTKIGLDDPLMAKAGESYCVAIITDSQDYTMWIGTLGENLINEPDETIVTQPYTNGVLFSSSNAVTWTAHQKSNLKFAIYTAEFQEEAIMEFDVMEDLDTDTILLMASYLTPDNTGCKWEVKIVAEEDVGRVSIDDVPWQPLVNYTEQETQQVVGLAKLRATFKSNRYTSPMLALDDLMFVNFIAATEGDYVSKNVNASESPFDTIKMDYDAFLPPGTSITPYYSVDRGETWVELKDPEISRQSSEYARYSFRKKISSSPTNENLKVKLTLKSETRFRRPRARRLVTTFRDEF